MYVLALATDYDGTLADHGTVSDEAYRALQRFKASGRKLIMVTGRELRDLRQVFPKLDIFDMVVAENGAVLYMPATKEERVLAPSPPERFVERMRAAEVTPLSVGRSVVAIWEPYDKIALELIKELGLELEIIFNKGSVMILPSGVNKATGLEAALEEMGMSAHNVIGVGDAENDHAFLRCAGYGVAVANALESLKETADRVTRNARSAGVIELIDDILAQDGALLDSERQRIPIGSNGSGRAEWIAPHGGCVLLAGSSGIGKSTLATALIERFVERGFQFAVLDPEGDYEELADAVVNGGGDRAPHEQEIFDLLANPSNNVVVNMLGLQIDERPTFFADLLPELAGMRARAGRPHWLVIDEAHHLMPASRDAGSFALPEELPATILITVHPDLVSADVLKRVETVIALGPRAGEVIEQFCRAIGSAVPQDIEAPPNDHVLFWNRTAGTTPRPIAVEGPRQQLKRHQRKYAEGDLGDHSFFFRGPDGALKLKAQNLTIFLQLAEGVDDRTWEFHLRAGDYSRWFRDKVKDEDLASEAETIEADGTLDAEGSRSRIAEAVLRRYTAPVR